VSWVHNDLGATGDVAWNQQRQTGFLHLRGLPVNDPADVQYQLWIFDAARRAYSADIAIDGGVFNVDGDEVVIPIRAALDVFEPELFAVTTEPPGGVVKHVDQGPFRIILTAPVSG